RASGVDATASHDSASQRLVGAASYVGAPAGGGIGAAADRPAGDACDTGGCGHAWQPRRARRSSAIPAVRRSGGHVNAVQRARLADDLVRRLAASIRSAQLYSSGHPIVVRSITALTESLAVAHAATPSLAIGIVGEDLVVGEIPVPHAAENMGELMRRLQQAGVERIVVERGVETTEITRLIQVLAAADPNQVAGLAALRYIRVG